MEPFVTWQWCESQVEDFVLVDSRWYWDRSGFAAYRQGHVPGAVFVDLDTALTGEITENSGRGPFPTPEDFAAAMSRAGIDGTVPVVAYDDAGGVIAARLVWMLRLLEVPASVVSGGIQAFTGKLETTVPQSREATFLPRPWPAGPLLSTEELAADESSPIVDARPANRFRGEEPEVDRNLGKVPEADPRRGHIPGAMNVPCRQHLQVDSTMAPPEVVRETFAAAGVLQAADVVSYCGAGVTACHNLLSMEHAGLGRGKLYPGSWSAWSRTAALPIETGSTT